MLEDVEVESEDAGEEEGGSWFARTRGGARTFSAGFIFLASICLLFWNESFGKKHADGLDELADLVRPAATASIDPANEGQPVHLSAAVRSQAGARDPYFGIRTDGVAVYRHVQMFQWIEYAETSGRGRKKKTEYYYEMGWDSDWWDSSRFEQPQGHQNPKPTIVSDGFFAEDARFGPYRFDDESVARRAILQYGNAPGLGHLGNWPQFQEQLPQLSSELERKRWYALDEGTYYRGNQNVEEAELGDLQVQFFVFRNDYPLSLIGAQQGDRIVPWRASNGDEILLAGGGNVDAQTLIKVEAAEHASFTHLLRIVGLIGAVIGAAGIGNWLGGFLGMIPLVGSVVSFSLTVAGGLFGLMAGLATIVIGWLAARPWIAALLLIAIGSALTWAIQKRRRSELAESRARRAAGIAAAARERAAQAAAALAGTAPQPAMAAAGGTPPPPPPAPAARVGAAARPPAGARAPTPPPPPPAAQENRELPPLEWTPGLISTKPPAVRARPADAPAAPPAPSAASPTRPATPAAPATAIPGFDLVAPVQTIPGFDLVEPGPPKAAAAPAIPGFDIIDEPPPRAPAPASGPAAKPRPPAKPAAPTTIPGFDLVEARPVAAASPGFETAESNPFIKPMQSFDSGVRTRPDSLFDTVPALDARAPRFDQLPTDDSAVEFPQLALQGALSAPSPAPAPATPVAKPDTAPAGAPAAAAPAAPSARNVRIALGSKGAYQLAKIVRQHADGRQEVLCFELLRDGQVQKRGSQEDVKEALRRALGGQG